MNLSRCGGHGRNTDSPPTEMISEDSDERPGMLTVRKSSSLISTFCAVYSGFFFFFLITVLFPRLKFLNKIKADRLSMLNPHKVQ